MSVEYRAKLFWVIEAGLFIDAGNIWTIRDYKEQPYGKFRFSQFYKQISAANSTFSRAVRFCTRL